MGLLSRLFKGSQGDPVIEEDASALWFYARCGSCGEVFRIRVDKQHEVRQNFEGGAPYLSDKFLLGSRCKNVAHVSLEFDQRKRCVGRTIEQGEFITRGAYQAALQEEPQGASSASS